MRQIFTPGRIIFALILAVVVLVGFGTIRSLKAQPHVRPAHTVLYKLTTYDEAGNVIFRSTAIRRVLSNGQWQETQIMPDGRVNHTKGQVTTPYTKRVVTDDMETHATGFKVFEEDGEQNKTWISPELQEDLQYVSLYPSGAVHWTREAIEARHEAD